MEQDETFEKLCQKSSLQIMLGFYLCFKPQDILLALHVQCRNLRNLTPSSRLSSGEGLVSRSSQECFTWAVFLQPLRGHSPTTATPYSYGM